jgi:tetratricopeptide (TPR) repeat protein
MITISSYRIIIVAILCLLQMGQFAYAGSGGQSAEDRIRAELSTASRRYSIKLYVALGKELFFQGNYDAAVDAYEHALALNPRRHDRYHTWMEIGDCYLRRNHYSSAIEAYQEAVGIKYSWEDAHVRLARAYLQSDLFELAMNEVQYVLSRNENSYDGNFLLGSLYMQQGLYTVAIEHFQKAMAKRPHPGVYRRIAACAKNTHNITLAITMLRQVPLRERTYDDYIDLGWLYKNKGSPGEAEQMVLRAIEQDNERYEAYLCLGLLSLDKGDLSNAEKSLQIAQEKEPDEGLIHFFLAQIYFRQHNIRRAQYEIAKAVGMSKSSILSRYSLQYFDFIKHSSAQNKLR